jgi:hypothetical protein
MFKSLSIYEGEKGDPYDLIIPIRRVEYAGVRTTTTHVTSGSGGGGGPVRSGGGSNTSSGTTRANADGPSSANADGPSSTRPADGSEPGTRNSDDSVNARDADGKPVKTEAGSREANAASGSKPSEADVQASRTPEEQTQDNKSKKDLMDKLSKGLMLLPMLLPLGLVLAGFVQGLESCVEINGRKTAPKTDPKKFTITNVKSAGMPSFYPVINTTKVDLTYSPCYKILKSDKMHIKTSNIFDGDFDPTSTTGECKVRIDIGKPYTANTYSNTATFTLTTDCAARMAYSIGDDASTILQTAGDAGADLLGGFMSGIPWSTILFIIGCIVAAMLAFKALAIFKSSQR